MFEGNKLICPISKSSKFLKLFTFRKFPIYMGVVEKNYKAEFKNLCFKINKISGSVQIDPKVPLKKLYFKPHGSGTVGKIWKNHHLNFFSFISDNIKGKIIEIGGGHNSVSENIDQLKSPNSYDLISYDPNIKKKSVSKFKHTYLKRFFSKGHVKKNFGKVNLIIHSHLFEHIYDPNKFLKDIFESLEDNGYHMFSVPNLKSMIKSGFTNAMNFEHPYFLEEDMIDYLLKKNGFEIIKKKKYLNHSIFYKTIKSDIKNKNKIKKYKKFIANKKLFLNFNKKILNDVKKINKLIENKKEVFLFGAHIFSQVLISHGLNVSNIEAILDNDINKQKKYLYGTNIKVNSPNILIKKNHPIIILRAAQYNHEIKKQIITKINNNTKFI